MLLNVHLTRIINKDATKSLKIIKEFNTSNYSLSITTTIKASSSQNCNSHIKIHHHSPENTITAMNDHRPPPRLVDLRSATDILRQTTTVATTRHHLRTLLILTFLLFSLRTNIENLTNFITSYIDNDPSVQSLLSRSQPPASPTIAAGHRHRHRRHHHHPFHQLTRILDDDLFSGDDEVDHRIFAKSQFNETSLILDSFDPQLGFSDFASDNGIRFSEIVRSSVRLSFRRIKIIEKEKNTISNSSNDLALIDGGKTVSKADLRFFFIRSDLEHHELNTLLYLIGVLSGSDVLVILAYVVTHVWVHGVVFVLVVNHFLQRDNPFTQTFERGAILGSRRLCLYIIMRWVVRDALSQLLGVFFFGDIDDQYSAFKVFVRLKYMPFSIVSPWVKGFEKETYGFLLSWFLLDMLISFVFALTAWVTMVDFRRRGREVIVEGWRLLLLRINTAINLKCLEGIACGSFARHILTHIFGKVFASMIISSMEVYFMVAWMVHYFSVKSMDANFVGVPFGNRELEEMLEDDR